MLVEKKCIGHFHVLFAANIAAKAHEADEDDEQQENSAKHNA